MGEETQYCTNCKKHISRENYMIHTAHCARNITICEDCKEPVPIKEMIDHATEMHSMVTCEKCNKNMQRWKLEDHADTCTRRPINCIYCELSCPWDEIKDHESYCGARTEQCGKCRRYVLMRDKKDHLRQNCSEARPKNYCNNCNLVVDSDMVVHQRLCRGSSDIVKKLLQAKSKDKEPETKNIKEMISEFSKLSTSEKNARQNFSSKDEEPDFCFNCEKYISSSMTSHQKLCKSSAKNEKKEEKRNFCRNCEKYIASDIKIHQRLCKKPVKGTEKDMVNDNSIKNSTFKNQYVAEKGTSSGTVPKWKFDNQFNEAKENETHEKVSLSTFENNRIRHPGRVNGPTQSSGMDCIINCPSCNIGFPVHVLDDHIRACEKREEICVICEKGVPISQIKMHQENCAKQAITAQPGSESSDIYFSESSKQFKQQITPVDRHRHHAVSHRNTEICPVCRETLSHHEFRDHLTLCVDNAYQLQAFIENSSAIAHFGPQEDKCICIYCSIELPLSMYDRHVFECGKTQTTCFVCGKGILIQQYQDHLKKCVEMAEKKEKAQIVDQSEIPILSHKQKRKVARIAANFSPENKTCVAKKCGAHEPVLLPCEFCEAMIPEDHLIEHQSGCKPELLHYPQPTEEEYFSASEDFDYGKKGKHKTKAKFDNSTGKKMRQEQQNSKKDSDDDAIAPGEFLGQYKKEDVVRVKTASSLSSSPPKFVIPHVNAHQVSHSHTSSLYSDTVKSEVHKLKSDHFKNRCKKVSVSNIDDDDDKGKNEDSLKNTVSQPEQKYNFKQFYGHSMNLDFNKEQNISQSSASFIEALGYKCDNKFCNVDLSKSESISDDPARSFGNQKAEYVSVIHTLNQGAIPKSKVCSKKPTKSPKSKKKKGKK